MLRDRESALLGAQTAMRRWLRLDVRRWAPAGVAAARRLRIMSDPTGGYEGRIVSFEPLGSAYTALERACAEDPLWSCRRLALSDSQGEAELHAAGNAVSSSLLDMEARHLEAAPESQYVGHERVRQARLDQLAGELELPADGLYLKVDVQGLESRVIKERAERCRGSSRSRASYRSFRCTATRGSFTRCSICWMTRATTRSRSSPPTRTPATVMSSRSTASS